MPFDVLEADPADDAIVSQFPANERASRQAIVDWMNHEHDEVSGRHKIPAGSIAARDGFTDWKQGSLWINTDANPDELQIQVNAASPFAWVTVGPTPTFEAGTKQLFLQASAPTGWTQDTTINDKVLRLVSGTGGGTGGSWSVSGFQADSHVLTIAEIPAHTHTEEGATGSQTFEAGTNRVGALQGPEQDSGSTGGGGGHTHTISNDGNWRPAHADVIAATKD